VTVHASHTARCAIRYLRYLPGIHVPDKNGGSDLRKRASSVYPVYPVALYVALTGSVRLDADGVSRSVMYRRSTGKVPESAPRYRIRLVTSAIRNGTHSYIYQDQTTVCIYNCPGLATRSHKLRYPVHDRYRRYRKYRIATESHNPQGGEA
jgi:hypothetical protein